MMTTTTKAFVSLMSLLLLFSTGLFQARPGLDKTGTPGGIPLDHVSQVKEEEPVATGSSSQAEREGFEA